MQDFEIRPLTGAFGAEVIGLDTGAAASPETLARVKRALLDHALLVFRDQDLTPEQHISFSRHFGELEEHVQTRFLLKGHPEIFVVSNVTEGGKDIGAKNCALTWHSDHSYMALPSLGSLFYAVTIPKEGGETCFADMRMAYDDLPAEKKQSLTGLQAVHDYYRLQQTQFPDRPLTPDQLAKAPPVTHPVVRTHPESGRKSLFLGGNVISKCFDASGKEQSRDIVMDLLETATQERYVYTHSYRPGDMVFWDNRCTMHRAAAYDDGTHPRIMHRTTILGDKPF
jgi:taurine dioxygenase